ncbi:MAG TPA: hypothetical protein VGC21_11600 [Telluria sp.]
MQENSAALRAEEGATIWFGNNPVRIDTLLDSASLGIVIDAAYAINDKGQIAATRLLASKRLQPLLLTPRPCNGTSSPGRHGQTPSHYCTARRQLRR